jgi:hypothetical protein
MEQSESVPIALFLAKSAPESGMARGPCPHYSKITLDIPSDALYLF